MGFPHFHAIISQLVIKSQAWATILDSLEHMKGINQHGTTLHINVKNPVPADSDVHFDKEFNYRFTIFISVLIQQHANAATDVTANACTIQTSWELHRLMEKEQSKNVHNAFSHPHHAPMHHSIFIHFEVVSILLSTAVVPFDLCKILTICK